MEDERQINSAAQDSARKRRRKTEIERKKEEWVSG
jgi:hypothetical protein